MINPKQIADTVTLFRLGIAILLAWLGISGNSASVPIAVWLMIVDFTGDALDGRIARRANPYYRTWIGDHDLEVDMSVSLGLLIFLIGTELIALWIGGVYLLIWLVLFIWLKSIPRALGMIFQAFIYGYFLAVAIWLPPHSGFWLVGWIVLAMVVTWPFFIEQMLPGFFSAVRAIRRR